MRVRWRNISEQALRPGGLPTFMVLAGGVGVAAGMGAALLIGSIRLVQEAWGLAPPRRGLVFVTVPIGLIATWALTRWSAPEAAGHGVPQIIASMIVRGGHMSSRIIPVKIAATALTIGSGGSAGREGPIAQIGAALGSTVSRWTRLGEDQVRSLVAAGAGAGIAATFNAPIAGMLFAMEVVLGQFSVRHLNAVVVACVAAAVTSRSLVGAGLIFDVPPYGLISPWELILYGILGLLAVGLAYLFLRSLDWWDLLPPRLSRFPAWTINLGIGLIVAALGFLQPEILGTGQRFVGSILRGEAGLIWWVMLLLAVLKVVATAATFGARGSGGIFMPSLFAGATLGSGLAQLLGPYWGLSPLRSGAFALVGMAAVYSAVARALTSILIVFEITGDYRLVLPLMLATTLATFLTERLHPTSAYTMPLAHRGIRPTAVGERDLLDGVLVGDAMSENPVLLHPHISTGEAQRLLDHHRLHGLPVVDALDRLIGIIAVSDILRSGGPSDRVTVIEAMTPRPVTVTRDTPVSMALERMASMGIGRLPVVAEDDPQRIIGMFRREDAVRGYHLALGAATGRHLDRDRFRVRTDPGANFFEFEVPPTSVADGRAVQEVAWPEGCTLVSIRRGREVLVPSGPTVLRPGDLITAFGTRAARARLTERLYATAHTRATDPGLMSFDEPSAEDQDVPAHKPEP